MEKKLGKELTNEEEAHHIVPSTHQYKSAKIARKILEKHGIGINKVENGVVLSKTLHRELHTYEYMDKASKLLGAADVNKDEVVYTLENIAKRIRNRNFP